MTLNHLSLAVPDVAATTAFFETYFGFTCIAVKGDHALSILEGDNNFILVLSRLKKDDTAYPADFHIGFMLKNPQDVTDIYETLNKGGIAVANEPIKIRDTISFYFNAPGNFMVEVGCPA